MSDQIPTPTTSVPDGNIAAAKSRRTLIVLGSIGVGLVLLLLFIVSLVLMRPTETAPIAGPSATESASASPTATETPTPTETVTATPTPEPTAAPTAEPAPTAVPTAGPLPIEHAAFISFVAPRITTCIAGADGVDEVVPLVSVSWNSSGAVDAWFAAGDDDAADVATMHVPVQGDQDDFSEPQYFACGSLSNTYTITLIGGDGVHVSKSWTVLNKGDKFVPEPK